MFYTKLIRSSRELVVEERKKKSELVGRTAPPAGASICINPITFSSVHGMVLASIYLSG